MVKYFCDMCGEQMNDIEDTNFYILPVWECWSVSDRGKIIEDKMKHRIIHKKLLLCDKCAIEIADNLYSRDVIS